MIYKLLHFEVCIT